jgi:hypothetical protein
MSFIVLGQLSVEFTHVFRGRIFIIFSEMAQDRTVNLLRPLKGRTPLPPSYKGVSSIVNHSGLKARTHPSHEIGPPSTLAEPNDSHPSRLNGTMLLEIAKCTVHIFNDVRILNPARTGLAVILAIRAVPMIKLGTNCNEPLTRESPRHFLYELVNSVPVL